MTARRLPLPDMPFWPLELTREQAAAYVGVSPNTFDQEVADGTWPEGWARGRKGGIKTWNRLELEQRRTGRLTGGVGSYEERRNAAKNARSAAGR